MDQVHGLRLYGSPRGQELREDRIGGARIGREAVQEGADIGGDDVPARRVAEPAGTVDYGIAHRFRAGAVPLEHGGGQHRDHDGRGDRATPDAALEETGAGYGCRARMAASCSGVASRWCFSFHSPYGIP